MKFYLGLLACIVALSTGCKNTASRNVFNVEFAAASTADAFMKGYAVYWKAATNCPPCYNVDMGYLMIQRAQLGSLAKKVGASVEVVENLRVANTTNNEIAPVLETAILSLDNITTKLVTSVTNTIGQ